MHIKSKQIVRIWKFSLKYGQAKILVYMSESKKAKAFLLSLFSASCTVSYFWYSLAIYARYLKTSDKNIYFARQIRQTVRPCFKLSRGYLSRRFNPPNRQATLLAQLREDMLSSVHFASASEQVSLRSGFSVFSEHFASGFSSVWKEVS